MKETARSYEESLAGYTPDELRRLVRDFDNFCKENNSALELFTYRNMRGMHGLEMQDILTECKKRFWVALVKKGDIEKIADHATPRTFFCRIITNYIIDIKGKKNWHIHEVRNIEDLDLPERMKFEIPYSHDLTALEEGPIEIALRCLPEADQQLIRMFALEDRTYDEIADILHVPAGTIKSRLYRARERLFQYATEHPEDAEYLRLFTVLREEIVTMSRSNNPYIEECEIFTSLREMGPYYVRAAAELDQTKVSNSYAMQVLHRVVGKKYGTLTQANFKRLCEAIRIKLGELQSLDEYDKQIEILKNYTPAISTAEPKVLKGSAQRKPLKPGISQSTPVRAIPSLPTETEEAFEEHMNGSFDTSVVHAISMMFDGALIPALADAKKMLPYVKPETLAKIGEDFVESRLKSE